MKIKIISAFLIVLVMLQTMCLAENTIIIDPKQGMVDVRVNSGEENAYKDVALEMTGPFSVSDDLENIDSLIENVEADTTKVLTKTVFNEKKTDSNGSLVYTFYPLSDNMFYIVSVKVEDSESVYREIIHNVSPGLEQIIVGALNAATNKYDIKDVFENDE